MRKYKYKEKTQSRKREILATIQFYKTMQKTDLVTATENNAMSLFAGMDSDGFIEQTVEFFSTEGMQGVEIQAVLTDLVPMEIQGEHKNFVRGFIKGEKEVKMVYFGQHQIVTTFTRNNKGNGVQAKITFLGLEKLPKSGGKTINKFQIFAKAI